MLSRLNLKNIIKNSERPNNKETNYCRQNFKPQFDTKNKFINKDNYETKNMQFSNLINVKNSL